MLDLEVMKARLAKATPGPWYWDGVIDNKSVGLTAAHSGHPTVMDFVRWGMNGAAPRFRVNGVMKRADELAIPRQAHRPEGAFYEIDHPNAQLIAHAPTDLAECIAEIERLQDVATIIRTNEQLFAENQRLREVLEFYGAKESYYAHVEVGHNNRLASDIELDYGEKARQALQGGD